VGNAVGKGSFWKSRLPGENQRLKGLQLFAGVSSVTPLQEDTQANWGKYYRLRRWARLSVLALPVALILLVQWPVANWLAVTLSTLGHGVQEAVIFSIIGLATVAFAMPLWKWAQWRCPRCGEKFVQPKVQFGYFTLIPVCWRLVFDSHCVTRKLECGDSMIGAKS